MTTTGDDPMRTNCLSWWLPLLLLVSLAFSSRAADEENTNLPDIIQSNHEKVAKFSVVSRQFSTDRKQAVYVLKSDLGIFRCRLALTNTILTNLTIIVAGEKHCEGLDFGKNGAGTKDLRTAPGVKLSAQHPQGVRIEFNQEALNDLKPGGILQFVNQYR